MERDDDFRGSTRSTRLSVFLAASSVLRDAALAEDVAQEVFLALWRGGGYDPSRGTLGTYLRLVARSRAVDVWRRQPHKRADDGPAPGACGLDPSAAEEPSHVVLRAADRDLARTGVRSLPVDQRQAVGLTYWAGLTMQQAADAMDVPLGTAKSRVRLALHKLALDPAAHMAAANRRDPVRARR